MRRALQIALLFILMLVPAESYEYRMPVNIQSTSTPAILMPGDEAVLAIDLENGAASYGVGRDAGSGSYAQSALLSTPINRTLLSGSGEMQVTSEDYTDLGMIGPNDKITVYYKIEAAPNITSGTYFLDFCVVGGYDMIQINRVIPIKVDTAAVSLARADVPTKTTINLNVANPRENTLNAVTIVPSADGVVFSPDEYYIGTMDPDEVFTISFSIDSSNRMVPISRPVNLSFVSRFKNGDNWHESAPYVASYTPPVDRPAQNGYILPAGIAALVILALGGYMYRRKRNSNRPKDNGSRTL